MEKVVQAHGANIGASCSVCKCPYDRETLDKHIDDQIIMYCDKMVPDISEDEESKEETKENVKMKKCGGPVKPNIVFFGEKMNPKFFWGWERITNLDINHHQPGKKGPKWDDGGCDLMITIGTGLAVFPFQATVTQPEKGTPNVLINLGNTASEGYDFEDLYNYPERLFIPGYCDETIKKIAKDVGWDKDLEKLCQKSKNKSKEESKNLKVPSKIENKRSRSSSRSSSKGAPKKKK